MPVNHSQADMNEVQLDYEQTEGVRLMVHDNGAGATEAKGRVWFVGVARTG